MRSVNLFNRAKKAITIITLFFLTFVSCDKVHRKRIELGEVHAKNELKIALSDTTIHNVINLKAQIIKDKETAISVTEPILFHTYKKENIIKQRPYEVYLIDDYWIVSGTLPEGSLGGTFLIILDARNSRIIRLTHGK